MKTALIAIVAASLGGAQLQPATESASSPAPAPEGEPAGPCQIAWSGVYTDRYRTPIKNGIDRRCAELVDALEFPMEPGSIKIAIGGEMGKSSVRVAAWHAGRVVSEEPDDGDVCECVLNDLVDYTMKRVAKALQQHTRDPDEPQILPPPSSSSEPRPPQDAPASDDRRPRFGVLGRAGLGVAALGLAAGAAGGLLFLPSETEQVPADPTEAPQEEERYRYRNPALGLSIAGAAVFATGLTLFIVDRYRSKRSSPRTTTLAPSLSPTAATLSLRAKF